MESNLEVTPGVFSDWLKLWYNVQITLNRWHMEWVGWRGRGVVLVMLNWRTVLQILSLFSNSPVQKYSGLRPTSGCICALLNTKIRATSSRDCRPGGLLMLICGENLFPSVSHVLLAQTSMRKNLDGASRAAAQQKRVQHRGWGAQCWLFSQRIRSFLKGGRL